MEENLTRKQRRAIPLILAEKTIETGCRVGIAGADRLGEGRGEMMKRLRSFSLDRQGRGRPEKPKNRPFPSTFVQLSISQNVVFP